MKSKSLESSISPRIRLIDEHIKAIYVEESRTKDRERFDCDDTLSHVDVYGHVGDPDQDVPPHWHYISYGLSDLPGDNTASSEDGEQSDYGFELTFRLKKQEGDLTDGQPPKWPVSILLAFAEYVKTTGNILNVGDHIPWNRLLDLPGDPDGGPDGDPDGTLCAEPDSSSLVRHILITEDPELMLLQAPAGTVHFRQLIGVLDPEIKAAQNWKGSGVLDLISLSPHAGGAYFVTDMSRTTSVFDHQPYFIKLVGSEISTTGSNLAHVTALCQWEGTWREGGGASVMYDSEGKAVEERELSAVNLFIDVEAAELLPVAARGRLGHGNYFLFENHNGDVILFIPEGCDEPMVSVDMQAPLKAQDNALQNHQMTREIHLSYPQVTIIIANLKEDQDFSLGHHSQLALPVIQQASSVPVSDVSDSAHTSESETDATGSQERLQGTSSQQSETSQSDTDLNSNNTKMFDFPPPPPDLLEGVHPTTDDESSLHSGNESRSSMSSLSNSDIVRRKPPLPSRTSSLKRKLKQSPPRANEESSNVEFRTPSSSAPSSPSKSDTPKKSFHITQSLIENRQQPMVSAHGVSDFSMDSSGTGLSGSLPTDVSTTETTDYSRYPQSDCSTCDPRSFSTTTDSTPTDDMTSYANTNFSFSDQSAYPATDMSTYVPSDASTYVPTDMATYASTDLSTSVPYSDMSTFVTRDLSTSVPTDAMSATMMSDISSVNIAHPVGYEMKFSYADDDTETDSTLTPATTSSSEVSKLRQQRQLPESKPSQPKGSSHTKSPTHTPKTKSKSNEQANKTSQVKYTEQKKTPNVPSPKRSNKIEHEKRAEQNKVIQKSPKPQPSTQHSKRNMNEHAQVNTKNAHNSSLSTTDSIQNKEKSKELNQDSQKPNPLPKPEHLRSNSVEAEHSPTSIVKKTRPQTKANAPITALTISEKLLSGFSDLGGVGHHAISNVESPATTKAKHEAASNFVYHSAFKPYSKAQFFSPNHETKPKNKMQYGDINLNDTFMSVEELQWEDLQTPAEQGIMGNLVDFRPQSTSSALSDETIEDDILKSKDMFPDAGEVKKSSPDVIPDDSRPQSVNTTRPSDLSIVIEEEPDQNESCPTPTNDVKKFQFDKSNTSNEVASMNEQLYKEALRRRTAPPMTFDITAMETTLEPDSSFVILSDVSNTSFDPDLSIIPTAVTRRRKRRSEPVSRSQSVNITPTSYSQRMEMKIAQSKEKVKQYSIPGNSIYNYHMAPEDVIKSKSLSSSGRDPRDRILAGSTPDRIRGSELKHSKDLVKPLSQKPHRAMHTGSSSAKSEAISSHHSRPTKPVDPRSPTRSSRPQVDSKRQAEHRSSRHAESRSSVNTAKSPREHRTVPSQKPSGKAPSHAQDRSSSSSGRDYSKSNITEERPRRPNKPHQFHAVVEKRTAESSSRTQRHSDSSRHPVSTSERLSKPQQRTARPRMDESTESNVSVCSNLSIPPARAAPQSFRAPRRSASDAASHEKQHKSSSSSDHRTGSQRKTSDDQSKRPASSKQVDSRIRSSREASDIKPRHSVERSTSRVSETKHHSSTSHQRDNQGDSRRRSAESHSERQHSKREDLTRPKKTRSSLPDSFTPQAYSAPKSSTSSRRRSSRHEEDHSSSSLNIPPQSNQETSQSNTLPRSREKRKSGFKINNPYPSSTEV